MQSKRWSPYGTAGAVWLTLFALLFLLRYAAMDTAPLAHDWNSYNEQLQAMLQPEQETEKQGAQGEREAGGSSRPAFTPDDPSSAASAETEASAGSSGKSDPTSVAEAAVPPSASASAESTAGSEPEDEVGKVNINTAGLTELMTLRGIGASKAQAILDYRTEKGVFRTLEQLKQVKGIGDKTFEALKSSISIGK